MSTFLDRGDMILSQSAKAVLFSPVPKWGA
jgi:hypothetical protein